MRTTFLDYDTHRTPKTDFSCVACQRDLPGDRSARHRVVHMIRGEPLVVHPDDVRRPEHCEFPIGEDCAKRLGLKWTSFTALPAKKEGT